MAISYMLEDNYKDMIRVSTLDKNVYVALFSEGNDISLSTDKARQLIEYLQQALADVEGSA